MKIGIVGGGVVGHATARAFIEHVDEVRVYDLVKERSTHTLGTTLLSDLVFVCLPTPQKDGDRACDLSAVDDFFHYARDLKTNFVLRSTVPVGTTRRLREQYGLPNLVHSPEFLTARCAVTDAQLPARNVIGYPATPRGGFGSEGGSLLHRLYDLRFPGVPVHVMTSDESEAVKLFQNSFFAVKVAFWNECQAFAEKAGLDWDRVLKAVLADGRISHSHTKVPGPDGSYGFGGTCLPKDLANLAECMDNARGGRVKPVVIGAALMRNAMLDRKPPGVDPGEPLSANMPDNEFIRHALARDMGP